MKASRQFDDDFLAGLSPMRRTLFDYAVKLAELRETASIRDCLFKLIFAITPADRAAVFVDHTLCEVERGELQPRIGKPNDVIERTVSSREAAFSDVPGHSTLCLPLVTAGNLVGAMYLESVDADNALDQIHRFLLTGVAPIVANAFDRSLYIERLEAENSRLHEALDSSRDLVGSSPAIARVKEQILKVAPTDATVLIQGESGTGKEVTAQCIHQNSKRKDAPFVAVNCGAIPESLRESELFGHEKGAFTGAAAQRKGKIELADRGTLFLDEVAELSLSGQAALLRVLQERTFERLGGTRTIPVDVRIIAATNSDLEAAVKAGRFRQDLFFRLQVIVIRMPALRDRPEDIVTLATHFVAKHAGIRRVSGWTRGAESLLTSYKWPGNVRELENTVMRALVLGAGDSIAPEDLPEALTEGKPSLPVAAATYQDQLNAAKRSIVQNALEQTRGDFYEAARLLDVHRSYLYRLADNLKIPSK